jgi:hypothetical protein
MAACSIRAYASRCRFHASGVDGAGMARSSVAAATSFWLTRGASWVVDVEVDVDALAGLLAQLARTFAARGGFPDDGGVK